jgi:hypothetical protein
MSELLRSGRVGNIQTKALQEQRQIVLERWEETGLLEGLDTKQKTGIAQLLENQAGALLEADNSTSNIAGFDIIVFPMVRRVFSRLLANDIVSVQPMNLPSGLLFYLDNQVETTTTGVRGGYSSVYDAHYNNGGHDFSFGTGLTTNGSLTATTGGSTARTIPYAGGEAGLASLRIAVSTGATAADDSNSGLTTDFAIAPQTWTQDLFKNNQISVILPTSGTGHVAASKPGAIGSVWTVYEVYEALEANSNMAEVKLIVTSTTVSVEPRKMKAHWTPELAQDLAAYHSIDAEAELTALLSEELAAEIDREIIRDLIRVAPYQTSWSYDRTAAVIRVDGTSIAADPASGYVTQKEWNQTLMTQINKVSAQIHKAMLRGGANWIVCSTEVGSVLEDIEKFHAANSADTPQFNMGIEQIGTLGVRYTVYKDPYLPSWVCLIGHKGKTFMDTGYVYAPYIPFQLTPVVLDPGDFTPRKGIMTRYAKKVVNNKYYGLVRVVFPSSYDLVNA